MPPHPFSYNLPCNTTQAVWHSREEGSPSSFCMPARTHIQGAILPLQSLHYSSSSTTDDLPPTKCHPHPKHVVLLFLNHSFWEILKAGLVPWGEYPGTPVSDYRIKLNFYCFGWSPINLFSGNFHTYTSTYTVCQIFLRCFQSAAQGILVINPLGSSDSFLRIQSRIWLV